MPKVNQIIQGVVEFIAKNYFIVKLEDNYMGLVHISQISDYYVENIDDFFKIGCAYEFIILEVDQEQKRVQLGWKQIVPRYLKNPFNFEIKETNQGFMKLKKLVEREIAND